MALILDRRIWDTHEGCLVDISHVDIVRWARVERLKRRSALSLLLLVRVRHRIEDSLLLLLGQLPLEYLAGCL